MSYTGSLFLMPAIVWSTDRLCVLHGRSQRTVTPVRGRWIHLCRYSQVRMLSTVATRIAVKNTEEFILILTNLMHKIL